MRLTKLYKDFFNSEKTGGLLLVAATACSLLLANSGIQHDYLAFWDQEIGGHSVVHWINDGLMTVFFLMIGLELEREIYIGELSSIKKTALPIMGALGGMLVPVGIYLLLNAGSDRQSGAGIPMATDIAFAIGLLSLLGNRVPAALKVFLTALAVIDDLGAIVAIALFYTETIHWTYLITALGLFGGLLLLNRLKVHRLLPYLLGGVAIWYCMLHSGVHATLTGVLLAFAIPFGNGGPQTPSHRVLHFLHKPVAYVILPLFAMANTGLAIGQGWQEGLFQASSLGIMLGLMVGKPLGIFLFSYLGVKLRWCALPKGMPWKELFGAGLLGGIGFTMSLFITLLAFTDPQAVFQSKIAILVASLAAGTMGYLYLHLTLKKTQPTH